MRKHTSQQINGMKNDFIVASLFCDARDDKYLLPEMAAKVVKSAVQKHEGDVLVFLPGQGRSNSAGQIALSGIRLAVYVDGDQITEAQPLQH